MEPIFVYPGCFTPPTKGHFRIVTRAAEVFPKVHVICSTNEKKSETRWFSEEECKAMWKNYPLPENIEVETFSAFMKRKVDTSRIVMIRGIRNEEDMDDEKRVMKLNKEMFGIDKVFYIIAEKEYAGISATKVRLAAEKFDFQYLAETVPPEIVAELLKKTAKLKSLSMVVGRPGSGKSTFFEMAKRNNPEIFSINTDDFAKETKLAARKHFGEEADLIKLAIEKKEEFTRAIADVWFRCLAEAFRNVPPEKHLFVEVPYGLQKDKSIFRFLGNKVVYVGCRDTAINEERVLKRGTPEHLPFIEKIPDEEESVRIAQENGLKIVCVDTGGALMEVAKLAEDFAKKLSKEVDYADCANSVYP